jgi:hypothetical protein
MSSAGGRVACAQEARQDVVEPGAEAGEVEGLRVHGVLSGVAIAMVL